MPTPHRRDRFDYFDRFGRFDHFGRFAPLGPAASGRGASTLRRRARDFAVPQASPLPASAWPPSRHSRAPDSPGAPSSSQRPVCARAPSLRRWLSLRLSSVPPSCAPDSCWPSSFAWRTSSPTLPSSWAQPSSWTRPSSWARPSWWPPSSQRSAWRRPSSSSPSSSPAIYERRLSASQQFDLDALKAAAGRFDVGDLGGPYQLSERRTVEPEVTHRGTTRNA